MSTTLAPRARLPKNYELLLNIVESVPATHQTVYDVFVEARRRQPTIGYATVHRGLTRLCELGAILKVDMPGAEAAWYEPAAAPHAHLLCDVCHRVSDVAYQMPAALLADIAERGGVEIGSEIVVFRGRCHTCRETAS